MRLVRHAFTATLTALLAAGALVVSAVPGAPRDGARVSLEGDSGHGQAFGKGQEQVTLSPQTPTATAATATAAPTTITAVAPTTSAMQARATTPVVLPKTSRSVVPSAPPGAGNMVPVHLGAAGAFAVLTKTGVTDVASSTIRGNVGASPISGAIGLTCHEVRGTIYTVAAAGPLPCRVADPAGLTAAVHDQEAAYTDAAGRTNPDFVNLGAGQIGGLTLVPGLYRWSTGLAVSRDVTLAGGANDVWIFQIAGSLDQAAATRVRLTGGAQARNVFWQTAGAVVIGTTAHSEGTILSKTMIAMNTGASTNGRLLAQTQVTLQKNIVNSVQ